VDDSPIGPRQGGHDEGDPREQLAEMMLDASSFSMDALADKVTEITTVKNA
jgi:hypothetical protein